MCSHKTIDGQRASEQLKTIAAKQREIAESIINTKQQLSSLNTQVQQLGPTDVQNGTTSGTEDAYKDEAGMQRTLGEERDTLDNLLKLLEGLETKMQDEEKKVAAKEQHTRVTFGDRNSGFQAGIIKGNLSGFTFGGHASREGSEI